MKFIAVILALFAVLLAQTPPPSAPAGKAAGNPGMPPPVPPDTVVAEIGGKKYTAAELDKLIGGMPVQFQPAIRSNPRNLTQIFVFRVLEKMAEAEKLDQQSPYKEQLEWMRTQYLAQMESNNYRQTKLKFSEEEEKKYYNDHTADKFREAKVRVIYVAFRPLNAKTDDAKKLPTEAEAKVKAEDLRKQLAGGADFAALAQANSDDKTSAEKGGDYGVITHTSSSDALKTVVFALKAGDISEPVRQPAGFYLVRVDEFRAQPFDVVQGQVDEDIRNEKFNAWQGELQKQWAVKVENQNYFLPRLPSAVQPPQNRPSVPGNVK